MRHYHCLVPGCSWHTRAESDAEILRRASVHLKETHDEQIVRADMIGRIRARITDRATA